MREKIRAVAEGLARKTTRRGLFSRGANVAFGALIGAAAGTVTRPDSAGAVGGTVCAFPGRPCPCSACLSNGVCAKPCVILTQWYTSGCWVTMAGTVTCCDCDCQGMIEDTGWCGCGSDWHNKTENCPEGTA